MTDSFDFVIVGGGSAGSVLANRLSADGSNRVLVLEAGRSDYPWDLFIHIPGALSHKLGNRFYDWRYMSEPEPHLNGRSIYHARGKVLGGSSSINAMVFQRGNPADYQRWASDPGMEQWDYAHCLPYFKRMETCRWGDPVRRGREGPLELSKGAANSPLFQAFLEAAQQAGHELTDDVNGYRQEGFAAFDVNIRRGNRFSAARAYLHPVKKRPNLTIECRAFVTRVLLEGGRAVGVEYVRNGRTRVAQATEIILCGGAINSPQVLQLSGIGNARELEQAGIDVRHDLPGVGENLQDHLEAFIQHACTQPVSIAPSRRWRKYLSVVTEWMLFRSGPGATNHFEAGGFVRSNDAVTYPNLMFHFLPIAIRPDGEMPPGAHGYQVHVGPMYSNSRGSVKVRTAEPRDHPALRFNYLSTEQDRQEWVEAVRITRRILAQEAFKPFDGGELAPGGQVQSDDEILEWVKQTAETALHPSGTCHMGVDEMSVVDPATMRVHGIEGLRVVDASVMPYVTNANIYAPVMMVAEKATDLILGNTPADPIEVDYYQAASSAEA